MIKETLLWESTGGQVQSRHQAEQGSDEQAVQKQE